MGRTCRGNALTTGHAPCKMSRAPWPCEIVSRQRAAAVGQGHGHAQAQQRQASGSGDNGKVQSKHDVVVIAIECGSSAAGVIGRKNLVLLIVRKLLAIAVTE